MRVIRSSLNVKPACEVLMQHDCLSTQHLIYIWRFVMKSWFTISIQCYDDEDRSKVCPFFEHGPSCTLIQFHFMIVCGRMPNWFKVRLVTVDYVDRSHMVTADQTTSIWSPWMWVVGMRNDPVQHYLNHNTIPYSIKPSTILRSYTVLVQL